MKTTLLTNLKYVLIGVALVGTIGLAHADFPMPSAAAPGNNLDVPIHTGPAQVKNGGLSVNTFLANDNAQFKQQTFLKGTVFGGTPGLSTSTVAIGDGTAPANIIVNGSVSAAQYIQSTSVANGDNSNLCATTNGTIVTCTVGNVNAPTLTQIGQSSHDAQGETVQEFDVGPSVVAGNKFNLTIYYHTVTVVAIGGDNAESITQKMIAAINSTTDAQWREDPYSTTTSRPGDPNLPPTDGGTPGYPPTAQSVPGNADYFFIVLDGAHQATLYNATPN